MKKTHIILTLVVIFLASFFYSAFAQQTMSSQERTRQLQEEEERLKQRIEKKRPAPPPEEEAPVRPLPSQAQEQVLIKDIVVKGVTLIPKREIDKLIKPFINTRLTIRDMQKVADAITDRYRQKGYITSRAYLPPQKIEKGILEIVVIEGKMGDVQVKGNRYFKSKLLAAKITIKKGQPFNYHTLRMNLVRINEHPDRFCRAVFVPGAEPGQTDVLLETKDRLPIHLGFDWDNFGSRYIEKDRYSVRFSHNNLLGLDDKLMFQYQLAQTSTYFLKSIRYFLPVAQNTELGLVANLSRVKLLKEYEDSDARGKSRFYGMFVNHSLVHTVDVNIDVSLGFDYKDITNYQNQAVTSHDKLRVPKLGLDIDYTDSLGRTIFTNEFDFGVPDIMGGLKKQDGMASRNGAGGKFFKAGINLLRLQKMPFSSTLLWKNQVQLSPSILPAAEQFQIGGIANVRGYPPAEVVGDRGYAMTWEWTFPAYLIPRQAKVPFSKVKLYDALRVAAFYDWGTVRLKRPTGTEEKTKTLRSAGFGVRFNLPEDFSVRVDCGWPLNNTPSDSDHLHTWVQVSKNF